MPAWVCPSCDRRVPSRQTTCRCGFEYDPAVVGIGGPDDSVSASSNSASSAGGPGVTRGLVVSALVLALVAVVAVRVLRPAPDSAVSIVPPPSSGAPTPLATPAASPALQTPSAAADASVPSEQSIAAVMPTAAIPLTTPSVAAATSLEDVISQAMPAVVSIETSQGRGSGFFVKPGVIITNNHVVGRNSSVTVRMPSGSTVSGRVERTSAEVDLAIVQVDPGTNQSVLELGSAADVRVGQEVIAIGLAMGQFQGTVTRGIISAVRRTGTGSSVVLLQTDAAINPGNSGGPLLDRTGKAVGITTLKVAGAAESLGFAVAADHARAFLTGGSAQAPGIASTAPTSAPLAPSFSGQSDTEVQRRQGLQLFDEALKQVAGRASEVDDYWTRIKRECGGRLSGVYDRDWFAAWDNRLSISSPDPGCLSAMNNLRQAGDQVRTAMTTLHEHARRAGVFPGDLRQARSKYHLDWTGWDR